MLLQALPNRQFDQQTNQINSFKMAILRNLSTLGLGNHGKRVEHQKFCN